MLGNLFLKRTFLLLLTICLVLTLFSGCEESKTEATASETTTQASQSAGASTQSSDTQAPTNPVSDEKVKFTLMTQDFPNAPLSQDMPVIQELTNRTNVEIEFISVPSADWATKSELTIASDELYDIMFGRSNDYVKYYDSGTFLSLNEYIDEYAPNFKLMFDKFPGVEKNLTDNDGIIWYYPQLTERLYSTHEIINQDFLDEVGASVPTDLDEFYDVLKAFKGMGEDIIPWGVSPWLPDPYLLQPIFCAYDTYNNWYYFGGDKYEYGPYDRKDNFKQSLICLNTLYEEGLLDSSYYSISDDEAIKKLKENRVGFMFGWGDGYNLWGKGGEYGTNFVPMAPLAGPDGKSHALASNPVVIGFFVTKACENPDILAKWFNYIYGEEGITLMNWGIEDLTYEVVDGKKVYTDVVMQHEMGAVNGRRTFGIAPVFFPFVNTNDAEGMVVGELTAKHNEFIKDVTYPIQPILSSTPDEATTLNAIMGDVKAYVNESVTRFITGELSIDSEFDKFIAQLKEYRIEDAYTIRNEQLQHWLNN